MSTLRKTISDDKTVAMRLGEGLAVASSIDGDAAALQVMRSAVAADENGNGEGKGKVIDGDEDLLDLHVRQDSYTLRQRRRYWSAPTWAKGYIANGRFLSRTRSPIYRRLRIPI